MSDVLRPFYAQRKCPCGSQNLPECGRKKFFDSIWNRTPVAQSVSWSSVYAVTVELPWMTTTTVLVVVVVSQNPKLLQFQREKEGTFCTCFCCCGHEIRFPRKHALCCKLNKTRFFKTIFPCKLQGL